MEKPRFTEPLHAPIDSMRVLQDIIGHASERMNPNAHPFEMFGGLMEEAEELRIALESGDKQAVASELPDVFIFLSRIADHYAIDMGEAVTRKIERNAYKYPMEEVQRMVDSGMTHAEARRELKANWDRSLDKSF